MRTMNFKINTIGFIFLFIFLIGAVSAANIENETVQTMQHDFNAAFDIYSVGVESGEDRLEIDEGVDTEELQSYEVIPAPEKTTLKASDVSMYYKDGSKYSAALKDSNNNAVKNAKVKITIADKTYTKTTDKTGTVKLALNLKPGTYTVLSVFDGTDNYTGSSAKNTLKIKSTIKADSFKKIYKNTKKYQATFYDQKGKLLKNTNVKFKLNGKTSTVKTTNKGVGSLSVDLKPGSYTVKITNSKTGETLDKTVTVTPTITENKDLTKYYQNSKEFKVKIINSNGKSVGSGKKVTFTVKGVSYKQSTDKNGYAKINLNLNPGTYTVKTTYDGCSVSNKIIIKSLIESSDLTVNEDDDGKFSVKILTSSGKAASKKQVTFTLSSKSYTVKSNSNGIASLKVNLKTGSYKITTKYNGLKTTNKITVKKSVKPTNFTHSILIPTYVNVTNKYVYSNSVYALKTGVNGIIKMPKQDKIIVDIGSKSYLFTTNKISGVDSIIIDYKSYLVPFDGSEIQSNIKKENLKRNGIIISYNNGFNEITYQSTVSSNTEFFGVYANKGLGHSETITYIENEDVTAKVNIETVGFDELGLKYNLVKYYGKNIYDFNTKSYEENTFHETDQIRFANTNEKVTFTYFGNSVAGYTSKEDIITRFKVNGREELEKIETISYGLGEKYRSSMGFEVIQSYAIINEKIDLTVIDDWLSKSSKFINKNGIRNVYGMFLTAIETALMADELADDYAKEYDVTWKRTGATTILSGMNLEDTYIHILNSDMGMTVKGDRDNVINFKFINSMSLPELESNALKSINEIFEDNITSSLDSFLNSNTRYSIAFDEDLIYIHPDNSNSTIILNKSSGVVNALLKYGNVIYKGSSVKTTDDCCICSLLPGNIIKHLKDILWRYGACNPLSQKYLYPMSKLMYTGFKLLVGKSIIKLGAVDAALYGMIGGFFVIHDAGVTVRNGADKEQWYTLMDTVTYTRPGYFQGKKVYNIPNNDGGYDYIEIPVKSDLSLDRDNAQYISKGKVKKLSKNETYKYFDDDYWTPVSLPPKYWDKSWK